MGKNILRFAYLNDESTSITMHPEPIGVFLAGEQSVACFTSVSEIQNNNLTERRFSFFILI
ncbi:hypothetical protein DTC83_25950 [Salmonella enterica]|nr:hypothetical protein [Salmonella enterica]